MRMKSGRRLSHLRSAVIPTALLWSALAAPAYAATPAAAQPLSPYRLALINLHPGANTVPDFTPDHQPAVVFLAWRENGNAHGFNDYIFTVGNNIVGVDSGGPTVDDVTQQFPFDGEQIESSVFLVRGAYAGNHGVFLLTAAKAFGKNFTFADVTPVQINIYTLKTDILAQIGFGSTDDAFEPVATFTTQSCYASAQDALFSTLQIWGAGSLVPALPAAEPCTKDQASDQPVSPPAKPAVKSPTASSPSAPPR